MDSFFFVGFSKDSVHSLVFASYIYIAHGGVFLNRVIIMFTDMVSGTSNYGENFRFGG